MRILTLLKVLAGVAVLYLGYWIFYYEMVVWRKTLFVALITEPQNSVVFFGAIIFLVFGTVKKEFVEARLQQLQDLIPFFGHSGSRSEDSDEIPLEWLKENQRPGFPNEPSSGSGALAQTRQTVKLKTVRLPGRKYRIPGLRRLKQIIVTCVFLFNVVMSQGTLFASRGAEPFFWYFVLMAWICLEYLWKSRKQEQLLREIFKRD